MSSYDDLRNAPSPGEEELRNDTVKVRDDLRADQRYLTTPTPAPAQPRARQRRKRNVTVVAVVAIVGILWVIALWRLGLAVHAGISRWLCPY